MKEIALEEWEPKVWKVELKATAFYYKLFSTRFDCFMMHFVDEILRNIKQNMDIGDVCIQGEQIHK
jgi:hypothetical protein